jgi:CHAD domain-containing protein
MTPTQPLSGPFERLTRAFGHHLPSAIVGEVEPLHQGRVSTRRLREILPLCACEVPRGLANRARRRLRRVGRALGDVREIDVSIGIVADLVQRERVESEAGERLQRHLTDERDERRERMLDQLSSVNTRKLERDLADIARVLAMRQQTDGWAQLLAVRLESRAQRVQDAVVEAGALYISDRVHNVRIAAKKLRYALEVAGDTGEARTKRCVREVKSIQAVLGRLHDLEVLGHMIQDLIVPGPVDEPLNVGFETLRRGLDRECRELHSQYVGGRETLLKVCASAVIHAGRIWSDRGGELSGAGPRLSTGRVLKMSLPTARPTIRTMAKRD